MTIERSCLALKLGHGATLDARDEARLAALVATAVPFESGVDLITTGDDPAHVHLVISGAACRYKYLSDGRRAIVSVMIPGDLCDLHVAILGYMDHSIMTLTPSEIVRIDYAELEELLTNHPTINRACWWSTLVDEAVLREWLVNVGRRSSHRHLAHLFCELYTRHHAVGLSRDHELRMPFTQVVLGDMLGISAVHVQRVMSRLRDSGLITVQGRSIRINDFAALADLAEFDPGYLHLDDPARPRFRSRLM